MTGIASRDQLRMSLVRYVLVAVPLILLLGTLSGWLSNSGYSNAWFAALAKPSFMPPGWLFGVAWPILYILMGVALAMILHARGARKRGVALGLFAAQFALNLAWSPIFFAGHEVRIALVVIAAMFGLALGTAIAFGRIRRAAGLLMIPYLAWLCFAAALNWEILRLNPDAETLAPPASRAEIAL